MKKLLVLFMAMMLLFTGCTSKTQEEVQTGAEVVSDITVPEFKIKICGAKITNKEMEGYSLYKVTSHSTNSSGTKHDNEYIGYRLKDVLEVAQVSTDLSKATIICTDGYQMDYEGDLTADEVLIAISKDGETFKTGPWFAPCNSETTGDYAQDLDKIEINGYSSPIAGGKDNSEEKADEEEIAFPQDPVSEDKTDKITFGDFSFKINGQDVTNADLEGLKIFRNTVVTQNSKGKVSQNKYSGYVLKDVLDKLGLPSNSVKAVAADGYENELVQDLINNPLTIIAIEKDKEVGENGTVWLAPCSENTSGAYAKEVVELIVE